MADGDGRTSSGLSSLTGQGEHGGEGDGAAWEVVDGHLKVGMFDNVEGWRYGALVEENKELKKALKREENFCVVAREQIKTLNELIDGRDQILASAVWSLQEILRRHVEGNEFATPGNVVKEASSIMKTIYAEIQKVDADMVERLLRGVTAQPLDD